MPPFRLLPVPIPTPATFCAGTTAEWVSGRVDGASKAGASLAQPQQLEPSPLVPEDPTESEGCSVALERRGRARRKAPLRPGARQRPCSARPPPAPGPPPPSRPNRSPRGDPFVRRALLCSGQESRAEKAMRGKQGGKGATGGVAALLSHTSRCSGRAELSTGPCSALGRACRRKNARRVRRGATPSRPGPRPMWVDQGVTFCVQTRLCREVLKGRRYGVVKPSNRGELDDPQWSRG